MLKKFIETVDKKVSHLILIDSAELHRDTYTPVCLNSSTNDELKRLLLALYADPQQMTDSLINDQWEYRRDIRATVWATLDALKTMCRFSTEGSLTS